MSQSFGLRDVLSSEGNGYQYGSGLADWVICPLCQGEFIHLREVRVYQREEDDPTNCVVIGATSGVSSSLAVEGRNPSLRRDGVELEFECELGCEFRVTIAQHKGNTFTYVETHQLTEDEGTWLQYP